MPENVQNVTLDELKSIIHGLKMSPLSFIEDGAAEEIKAFIKALPSPEQLDGIASVPINITRLQADIGNIMRFIELYGKRDLEFKTRYKSRTGLPPRYKVLDWRGNNMKNANVIKDIVKLSSEIDDKGYGQLSGKINKFASKVVDNKFDEAEYLDIVEALKNNGLVKEAQFWQGLKGGFKGIGQGIKNVKNEGRAGWLMGEFDYLYKQMKAFKTKVNDFSAKLTNNPTLKKKMDDLSGYIDIEGFVQAGNEVKKADQEQAAAAKQQEQQSTQQQEQPLTQSEDKVQAESKQPPTQAQTQTQSASPKSGTLEYNLQEVLKLMPDDQKKINNFINNVLKKEYKQRVKK